jgi:hypothetical protein
MSVNKQTIINSFLLFVALTAQQACEPSTHLTKTWTDPSVNETTFKPFTKVLVVAHLKDETSNRIAEDKLVAQFKPGVAVPAYSYLQEGDTVQKILNARLQKDGFNGLLVIALTGIDKSIDINTYNYGGYYRYGYGSGTTTISENQTFMVETKIYSFETSKLLWTGTTSTYNPSSLEKALDDIILAIKNQLIKQGLVKQPGETKPGK